MRRPDRDAVGIFEGRKRSAWLEIIRGLGGRRRWGKIASQGEFTWGLLHTLTIGDFILITMGS